MKDSQSTYCLGASIMWKISHKNIHNKELFTRAVYRLRYDIAIERVFKGKMQVRDIDYLYQWWRGHLGAQEQRI